MKIQVQTAAFDVADEIAAITQQRQDIGGIVSFLGLVRDLNHGQAVAGMTLEHYPGMTEKALLGIAATAQARWPLLDLTIIHRVGRLQPADPIVLVLVAAAHRGAAFAACEFIMDYLKTRAPFWKLEHTATGDQWVEARDSDENAAARW